MGICCRCCVIVGSKLLWGSDPVVPIVLRRTLCTLCCCNKTFILSAAKFLFLAKKSTWPETGLSTSQRRPLVSLSEEECVQLIMCVRLRVCLCVLLRVCECADKLSNVQQIMPHVCKARYQISCSRIVPYGYTEREATNVDNQLFLLTD